MARKNGNTANDIAAIEGEITKLMHDLETRIGRLNTLTKRGAGHAAGDATDYVSESLSDAAERLREAAEEATAKIREGANAVSDGATRLGSETMRRLEEEIEQRPLMTLAIAAGIGFLAGLAGRRH